MQNSIRSTSLFDLSESVKFKSLALNIINDILSVIPNDENIFARSNLKKLQVDMMYFPPKVFDQFFWNNLYMICKEYINDNSKPYTGMVFEIYSMNLKKYNYNNNTFSKEYNKLINEKQIVSKQKKNQ